MNIPDYISESLETIFWVKILKFLKRMRIWTGPGMEKFASGKNIPDPQHWKNIFVIFVGILKTTEEQSRIQIRIRFRNSEVRVGDQNPDPYQKSRWVTGTGI